MKIITQKRKILGIIFKYKVNWGNSDTLGHFLVLYLNQIGMYVLIVSEMKATARAI